MSTRPQSRSWLSLPPAPLPSPRCCGARAGCRVSAVGSRARPCTLGLPICCRWGSGSWGRGGALGSGLNWSIALGSIPLQDPAGWQRGQAVPLPALPVPALGSLPALPLAAAAAAAEPDREQPPVPAASGPPSLFPSLSGGFSLPACVWSHRSAGVGGQAWGGGSWSWAEGWVRLRAPAVSDGGKMVSAGKVHERSSLAMGSFCTC